MYESPNETIRTLLELHSVYNVPEEAISVLHYFISHRKNFDKMECSSELGISTEFIDMSLTLFLEQNILKGDSYQNLGFVDNIFLAVN